MLYCGKMSIGKLLFPGGNLLYNKGEVEVKSCIFPWNQSLPLVPICNYAWAISSEWGKLHLIGQNNWSQSSRFLCKDVTIKCVILYDYYEILWVNIEFFLCFSSFLSSANASPEFEGRGGEELGSMLAKTLQRAYNHKSAIDLESLSILPGKQCWVLYIDALVRQSVNEKTEYGLERTDQFCSGKASRILLNPTCTISRRILLYPVRFCRIL